MARIYQLVVKEETMHGNGQSKLAVCSCGRLHVTYGSITLHFDRDEFQAFADSIGRLAAMLKQSSLGSVSAHKGSSSAHMCH